MPASRAEARFRVASPETSSVSRAAASAAAGHRESRLGQLPPEPRPDDLVPPSGDERDDPDAEGGDHVPHRPRDRPADEGLDAQLGQAGRFPPGRPGRKRLLRSREDPPGFRRDDVNVPRRVEDGCDPSVPAGEGRFRTGGGSVSFHASECAIPAPGREGPRHSRRTSVRRVGCARTREGASPSWSSTIATPFRAQGCAGATLFRSGRTDRPGKGARCRACGSAGKGSSCGCRAPWPPRAG